MGALQDCGSSCHRLSKMPERVRPRCAALRCREYLHSVPIVPEGGSLSYLFQLTKPPSAGPQGGSPGAAGGLGASPRTPTATAVGLGRLEMRWRGHMGQVGLLL